MPDFVHLHTHSCYSFHDGTERPEALASRAAALGFKALALTDTNGLYGAVPFARAAAREGISPVLGVLLDGGREGGPSALVLGREGGGYAALCRLVTARRLKWRDRDEDEPGPATALENLRGGLAAEADKIIVLASSPDLIRSLAKVLPSGGLYGELAYRGDASSALRCRTILETCRSLARPVAATNAVHFGEPGAFDVHQVLRAIGERRTVWNVRRLAPRDAWLKSGEEMSVLFKGCPEALVNSLGIAEECGLRLDLGTWKFPALDLKHGETPFSTLWKRSFEGLKKRYRPLTGEIVERLRRELEVIEERGFSPYFLVVDDIVRRAVRWKMRTIGRGSAACSLVSYCLGITHVDPLALGLHFERFLNPERSSPPDIDLDFSWKDRDRILDYVYETYGRERVAMISTHVTFGARAGCREIGKAYGLSEKELGEFTKSIPRYGVRSLVNIADEVPECRGLPVREEPYRTILALGEKTAGLPRHLSVHAGGIVISPTAITDFVPLERAAKGIAVTQYNMGPVEELGLIKIDLLSQRSLGVLSDTVTAVGGRDTGKVAAAADCTDLFEDSETRRLIREGRTMGCFYIESPAMRSLLRKLRTETFGDLTAASSVIRPGVAESGMMQEYIRRHLLVTSSRGGEKTGRENWYLHPLLREVLDETHGVMIYQEDVLKVAHVLAGMSLGEADSLRRSMSGKMRSAEAMAQVRTRFLAGCGEKDIPGKTALEIWRQIESFAGYAFCKAHSASYALLSFQVAWLKAHFPAPFMAAVISNGGGFYGTEAYISEAKRLGIRILLPGINKSGRDYTGAGRKIRMGLGAIGTLGETAIESLLEGRRRGGPFTSLSDLMERTELTRGEMELLIRSGACDCFELSRPEMLWRLACRRRDSDSPPELFPGIEAGLDALVPRLPEYPLHERCRIEEEIFGFPVSRHHLELLPPDLFRGATAARDMGKKIGRPVRMVGRAIAWKRVPVGKGAKKRWMKFLSLEDLTGTFEAVLFPRCYERFADRILSAGPYLLEGRIEEDHGVCSLNVEKVEMAAAIPAIAPRSLPL